MSSHSIQYSIEDLLFLRDSPLVTKPELPSQMEQWITQPAIERRNLQNTQSHSNGDTDPKYRSSEARRSRGDSIVLGPPQMSFASSLHSPPLRKPGSKETTSSSVRTRSSPPDEETPLSTSPPDEDEEAGWSKVRSGPRGNALKSFERRGVRGERTERAERSDRSDRRAPRESYEGANVKSTAFRNHREGDSQNWRSDRVDPVGDTRNGGQEERADFLEEEDEFSRGRSGGKQHSAEEFQEWIAKMRGGNSKTEDTGVKHDNPADENGASVEPPKTGKSKMLDVDSLFADSIAIDEVMTAPPTSSVFFDSAPTGRASRFRQLFTQDAPTVQPSLHDPDTRPGVDRTQSNPVFTGGVKPSSSSEDREGFQRIMAMLGGGGNKPTMPNFMEKPPPMPSPPLPPPNQFQESQGQNESKNEFFQRLLRQGHVPGSNAPPQLSSPAMPMNRPPISDQPRPLPPDLDVNMQARMNRHPPQQGRSLPDPRSPPDPRFPPYDLPPPPQNAPWMHPPPGFSPPTPNGRFPFPGPPPLSPGIPPPGAYGPPPPGMIPYGGPPPGFGRGGFSPPLPPPGPEGWHGPPGFGGGFYQEGDGRER